MWRPELILEFLIWSQLLFWNSLFGGLFLRTFLLHLRNNGTLFKFQVVDYGYHVIDMHYYALLQSFRRNSDGIHWSPESNRCFTNLIMTFLCLITKKTLPGANAITVQNKIVPIISKLGQSNLVITKIMDVKTS